MKQVKLGSWLIQYSETHNTMRVLINDEYLLSVTTENIESVLDAMEKFTAGNAVALTVQPMIRQELTSSVNYYTEDGEPEEVSVLNYELQTDDLSKFYHGEPEDVAIDFDSPGDAEGFYRDMLSHPSVDWIMY